MHRLEIPEEYVIVLQQIDEHGEEDFNDLAESLSFDRPRLAHIVRSLQHKGLVSFHGTNERFFWIRLSSKGQRLIRYLWPESGLRPSY